MLQMTRSKLTTRLNPPRRSPTNSNSRRNWKKVPTVVVVYHVTIVAIGHGMLKKFWPMVIKQVSVIIPDQLHRKTGNITECPR